MGSFGAHGKDVQSLMAVLLQKRLELRRRSRAIAADVATPLNADSTERATELENAEVLSELNREAIEELGRINMALSRMDAGSYGTCIDCGEDIDAERLKSVPWALRCLACEVAAENC